MRWFFGFFLVSGFCSLAYEVVWLRLAMAQFGVTTPMVSIVLSVFMVGLALGSLLGGATARRLERGPARSALWLYGACELGIGISGIVVPRALAWGRAVLSRDAGGEWGSLGHHAAAGAWVALAFLPFCTCMGATFPLAMAFLRQRFGERARLSFSYLYVANIVGACLGTLASAFLLIEMLGFRGTLLVAAGLNGLLAASAIAWGIALRREGAAPPAPDAARAGTARPATPPGTSPGSSIELTMLFATGLTSMAMEVVWVRQFTPYMSSMVYTFASILAVYLGATLIGSTSYRRLAASGRLPASAARAPLPWVLAALAGLLPLLFGDPRLPLPRGFATGALRMALGVAPFCTILGFLTPGLIDRWSGGDASRAGTAYAVNVVGCILGPLVAAFALLPLLGERWSLVLLGLPLFALGVRGGLAPVPRDETAPRPLRLAPLLAGLALGIAVVLGTRDFETIYANRQVRRDYTATVVAVHEGRNLGLLVNGVGMTALTPVTKMMAHLPAAFLAEPPESALVICFGMGTSFRSLLSWGARTTAVELVPSVPDFFGYFHGDASALLDSPLARIVIDDGRRFLERTTEQFDVITVDPPPPVSAAGSSLLYTVEFYDVLKKRLSPRGILQQWLPGRDPYVLSSVASALRQSFANVRVFVQPGSGIHFLASQRPVPVLSAETLAARLPQRAAADLVEWAGAGSVQSQFAGLLGREVPLYTISEGAPFTISLRDDRPINEYFLLHSAFGIDPRRW